jgi:hypothetical protein
MADNVKLMSRNEALEAENANLKGKKSKLKWHIARERYQLREEKKLHEHVHSSPVEGRAVADHLTAAEARQLSETMRITSHALEEARKSLKELEDQVASAHTVPGRNINFDNPNRWTIAKDVDNMAEFSFAIFRDEWMKSSATEEEGAESTVNEGKAAYPLKVLGAFLKKHIPHMEVKTLLPGGALRKIEKEIADCIKEHFDEISVDHFIHMKVSTRGCQTILNLLSSKQGAEGLVMAVLPYGEQGGLHHSRDRQQGDDLATRRRLWHLRKEKCVWDVHRVEDDQQHLRSRASLNIRRNSTPVWSQQRRELHARGFLGGGDKYKHIAEKPPTLVAVVSELMSEEGMQVDGVKYTFIVTFGGKPPVMRHKCYICRFNCILLKTFSHTLSC